MTRWCPAAGVVLAVALASCGGAYPGTTLGAQVRSWARTTGLAAALRTLQADGARIPRVAAARNTAAVRTACDVLVTDALLANQNLPSPDGRLTSILTAAYAAAASAGRRCVEDPASAGAEGSVATQLAQAASGYVKAQARLDDIGAAGPGGST